MGLCDEPSPCVGASFDDLLISFPNQEGEFVLAEVFPDVFHWV
jgi:hypothetical protein